MELAAQIVGFCGTAGLFISYQQNTKNRILLFQIIGITMFTLHFFLLSAWSGCMMNLLGIGRALLQSVPGAMRSLGIERLHLYTTHESLYEKFGWTYAGPLHTFDQMQDLQRLYILQL